MLDRTRMIKRIGINLELCNNESFYGHFSIYNTCQH